MRALDADGAAWNAPQVVEQTGSNETALNLRIIGGYPAISSSYCQYTAALDADGTAWAAPVAAGRGEYQSLCAVNGQPGICYYLEGQLYFASGF